MLGYFCLEGESTVVGAGAGFSLLAKTEKKKNKKRRKAGGKEELGWWW